MKEKWQQIEEEVKLLKNEIKQVLLDIKERVEGSGSLPTISSAPRQADSGLARAAEKVPEVKEAKEKQKEEPVAPVSDAKSHEKALNEAPAARSDGGPERSGESALRTDGAAPALTGMPAADLLTVSMLSQWLTNGMKKVGRQRMEALVDIYSQLGGLSPNLKDILMKLLNTDEGGGQEMKDGVSLLVEVDNLLRRSQYDRNEAAVLSLFLNNGHSNSGRSNNGYGNNGYGNNGHGNNGHGKEDSHR